MKFFHHELDLATPPDEYRRIVQTSITPSLSTDNYVLVGQGDGVFTYTRRYIPGIYIFLAIILFPIGLLFLLIKANATIVLSVDPGEDKGSDVVITGEAPRPLIGWLGQLDAAE